MSTIKQWWRSLTGRPVRRYTVKLRGTSFPEAPIFEPDPLLLAHINSAAGTDAGEIEDLRPEDGPIFDQTTLGSCTANGWEGLHMFIIKKMFGVIFLGSRLMLYLLERKRNNNVDDDAGAEVADGAAVLSTTGVCPESEWPYDVSKFKDEPPAQCYTDAALYKLLDPMRLTQDLAHMKACIKEGYPFVFGFTVYESFESMSVSRTGIIPMPKSSEKELGGHEMESLGYIDGNGKATFKSAGARVGYTVNRAFVSLSHALRIVTGSQSFTVTPPKNVFIIRNSWNTSWGDKGYGYMPYAYLTNTTLASDFWTARTATYQGKSKKD